MKVAGTITVEVPECHGSNPWCHPFCEIANNHGGCKRSYDINWLIGPSFLRTIENPGAIEWAMNHFPIPSPTCPAFDSVPNPWPEICPDRTKEEWAEHLEEIKNGKWPTPGMDLAN